MISTISNINLKGNSDSINYAGSIVTREKIFPVWQLASCPLFFAIGAFPHRLFLFHTMIRYVAMPRSAPPKPATLPTSTSEKGSIKVFEKPDGDLVFTITKPESLSWEAFFRQRTVAPSCF